MLKQIFRENVPTQFLFDLLEKVCLKTDKYYLVDKNAYRKVTFHEYHIEFLQSIRPYYHESKQFYVDREFNYTSFINIVRQICKHNKVEFKYNIKYSDYKYNIQYYIYHS